MVRVVVVALLLGVLTAGAQVSPRAAKLHRNALVFDAHIHVINRQFFHGGDIGDRFPDGQFDLPRAREGGVDAFFFSLFVQEEYYPGRFETKQVLRLLDVARAQLAGNRDTIEVALNGDDVERIVRSGKMAAVLDLEGGFDLDGDLGVLRTLHSLGFRSLQLSAHNWANNFADSCCAPPRWHGLNERGRAVIREMNRLGMVINVSHASDETLEQAIEASSAPLVATHHGLRSFNNIPRTMPDDLLKKLAARGGVIAFHIGNSFHNRKLFEWETKGAGRTFWDTGDVAKKVGGLSIEEIDRVVASHAPVGVTMARADRPKAPDELLMSVDDWVAVVDRAIQIAGEDHVALGSDFDGGPTLPRGMRDVRDLALITDAMLRRGYTDARIRKFLGGNLMRVFKAIASSQ